MIAPLLFLLFTGPACADQHDNAVSSYERGDYEAAYRLFKPMAERGDAAAQFYVGVMYAKGDGVRQNYVLAHMWFNLAASHFPSSQKHKRKYAVKNRDLVASKMTRAQIAEAQRMARKWMPKKER